MNNSTSCSRKNTFLRISFLFVHVRMQEQNRVQSVWNKNTVNFKKVKLYLQYQYLQVVSSVNFWGTFLKFNFSSMVEPEPFPAKKYRLRPAPAPQHCRSHWYFTKETKHNSGTDPNPTWPQNLANQNTLFSKNFSFNSQHTEFCKRNTDGHKG